jgi:hypothetical protein
LEEIADAAGRAHTALTKEVNRIGREGLAPAEQTITQLLGAIEGTNIAEVRGLATYDLVRSSSRTVKDIEQFGSAVGGLMTKYKAELAADLDIRLPDASAASDKLNTDLSNLPGQVQSCMDEMGKPLATMFPRSLGYPCPPIELLDKLAENLAEFESYAEAQIRERLEWGAKEANDSKLPLFLLASEHFDEASNTCPVCSQLLSQVPSVRETLTLLRRFRGKPHLRQQLRGLELSLLDKLNQIISATARSDAEEGLSDRVRGDWEAIKKRCFPALLAGIAGRFDHAVSAAADLVATATAATATDASHGDDPTIAEFAELHAALRAAHKYIGFGTAFHRHMSAVATAVTKALKDVSDGGDTESLAAIVARGRDAKEKLSVLTIVQQHARSLWKAQKELDSFATRVSLLQEIADASNATKMLGQAARREALSLIDAVEPRVKDYYGRLYDDALQVDKVTSGHPANPNIKDEINVYFRAGDQRVPVGPFSNAGRLRALMLCFIFAMLDESKGSLGLILLDDPALSLDDQHKARLVDHLVQPWMQKRQVILATHYENFYKVAEPVFCDGERRMLPPRRTWCDAVTFEPSDLLQRVEATLASGGCAWREAAVNLRRWVERAVHTLSGYSPEPFAIFNNIPDSISAYAAIPDARVATSKRDEIVKQLRGAAFARVMHRVAHDEEPTESEVRDGLAALAGCRKLVDAEISRLKELNRHALLARASAVTASVEPLSLPRTIPGAPLPIRARAAAASNGVGITWVENVTIDRNELQVALITHDALSPVLNSGQYALIGGHGTPLRDADLALIQGPDGSRYARRYWNDGQRIYLEGLNDVRPVKPVTLSNGIQEGARVLGVLFDGPSLAARRAGEEWVPMVADASGLLGGAFGVRVSGGSMDPVAKDGEIVLVSQVDPESVEPGSLACVDIDEVGAVLKRCYRSAGNWILCPIGPASTEAPIIAPSETVLHVYRLVGVLFAGATSGIERPLGSVAPHAA